MHSSGSTREAVSVAVGCAALTYGSVLHLRLRKAQLPRGYNTSLNYATFNRASTQKCHEVPCRALPAGEPKPAWPGKASYGLTAIATSRLDILEHLGLQLRTPCLRLRPHRNLRKPPTPTTSNTPRSSRSWTTGYRTGRSLWIQLGAYAAMTCTHMDSLGQTVKACRQQEQKARGVSMAGWRHTPDYLARPAACSPDPSTFRAAHFALQITWLQLYLLMVHP